MRRRMTLLATFVAIALVGAACGRATEDEINQVLGITPTATLSPELIAAATEAAIATEEAREEALSSPNAAALGDVAQGSRQFQTWCAGCHVPGGQGPDIRSPGSVGASITAESLLPLIREGEAHPPGPYPPSMITNVQVADIAAYINNEASN